jgi:hypothetical protein
MVSCKSANFFCGSFNFENKQNLPEKIFDSFLLHSQINQLVNLTHHVGLSNVDMKTP